MLAIRLFRVGKKKQPSYKIVVTNKQNPPQGGQFVEQVGFYNPLTNERTLKEDRIKYWLSVGAQASDTVHNMLITEKVIEGEKRKRRIVIKEAEVKAEEPKKEEAPVEEVKEESPTEEVKEDAKPEETPVEEVKEEEVPTEEVKEEEPKPEENTEKEEEKKAV
ncbi:MAG: 30S ribosomal protein S16 [Candidatus Pacebacteria bacterium]|nr:30S ribosomal protein S16 [Candidatus Paceibacterota bacterium]MDD2757513.1 30S ribosomal protein S16 [Candidatus Paceibacterota bacterium]